MANQYRLGNRHNEERSPIYFRLFGSNISIIPTTTHNVLEGNITSQFINGGPRSVSSISARDNMSLSSLYPTIGGQIEVAPVVESDYQRSGDVVGNSSNANSVSSFNDDINTTTTGARNDELCQANSSFKRSRSPDPFTRGETSNQGSQIDERFSRRRTLPPPFHPYQDNVNNMSSLPTTTFWDHFIMDEDVDVEAGLSSTTTLSEINSSPGGPASFLYPSAATREATSSSSQGTSFSQNGDNNNNMDFFELDYWVTQNRLLHSQEHIDWITNSEDWQDEMNEVGLEEEEILMYIQQETYQPNTEETSTMNQTCTICQEDFIDGECIGRLDCNHIYHLNCIKQWLEEKNVCPICKKTALNIYEDDDDDDDESEDE